MFYFVLLPILASCCGLTLCVFSHIALHCFSTKENIRAQWLLYIYYCTFLLQLAKSLLSALNASRLTEIVCNGEAQSTFFAFSEKGIETSCSRQGCETDVFALFIRIFYLTPAFATIQFH